MNYRWMIRSPGGVACRSAKLSEIHDWAILERLFYEPLKIMPIKS
jgi:hypothetical protein